MSATDFENTMDLQKTNDWVLETSGVERSLLVQVKQQNYPT